MSSKIRKQALAAVATKETRRSVVATDITEIYGADVFNIKLMRDYLPKAVFKKLLTTIKNGSNIFIGPEVLYNI